MEGMNYQVLEHHYVLPLRRADRMAPDLEGPMCLVVPRVEEGPVSRPCDVACL